MDQQYKCGYCKFLINTHCEDYTSHECFMELNFDVALHDIMSDENGVLHLVDKASNTILQKLNKEATTASWEELLIKFVQDRPALYNIKIPVTERSHLKKNNLWAEIHNLLEGKHSLEAIKAKWRYLRDCYMKARKKMGQYKPSGSAAGTKFDSGFRYYASMQFLNDSLEMPETVCSVPIMTPNLFSPTPSTSTSEQGDTEASQASISFVEVPETPSAKKRRVDEKKEFQKGVLDILTAPPKASDGVDGFLMRLGESLRRFPYRERSRLEIDIMKLVFDRESELDL
ncbi:unnamed protein product [Ceutorhynchus assimilis]|uniref:MADF domain-containing protein n=1 Tax=Ceutorhynchus assimilis TaxID=467358 RepID=A0A9N9ML06_9CUCU|nr:unnamed protein product [Ceutorhynchus assimilis]